MRWQPICAAICALALALGGRTFAQQDSPAAETASEPAPVARLPLPAAVIGASAETSTDSLVRQAAAIVEDTRPLFQPYGLLWGRTVFATSRTAPGPFTLWVLSREEGGESSFAIDARATRLGVNIDGPVIHSGFELGGQVEIDFFGEFLMENRAEARLRHAYLEATNEQWRLLVGQTWDVVSPLWPGSLNFSVGWAGGNIGFRRAQVRAERAIAMPEGELLLQGSLNQDIVEDFPSEPGVRRETASYPVLQARVAYSHPMADGRRATLGFSGHFGETGFDFLRFGPPPVFLPPADDVRVKTWSFNMDMELPLTSNLMVRGEFFRGSNLSPFLGGIGQGVCPCLRRGINSTGGWLELVERWSPCWESHFGMGIDDPRDSDSLFGRTQNSFIFANLIWQVSDGLSTGWEVAWWRTLYHDQRSGVLPPTILEPTRPGDAVTMEWMVQYRL